MLPERAQRVEMIPIASINLLNPRLRKQSVFKEIVDNIDRVGLKRPITVSLRHKSNGKAQYDLVCGQGRLEAFRMLGQTEVPALVVSADPEDCLVSSIIENCARRRHHAVELLEDIGAMQRRGHSIADIARKTGLSEDYTFAVVRLLSRGEERLLRAVEFGQIPFSVAIQIADAEDRDVQGALQDAYEKKLLRGRKLLVARRIIEKRRLHGRHISKGRPSRKLLSGEAVVQAYEKDVKKKRLIVRRARLARDKITFVAEALRRLLDDRPFKNILVEEGLDTFPRNLTSRSNISKE